jgi:hypothetical protein
MASDSERKIANPFLWPIVWALAYIAFAIFFKGFPNKDWIQSVLLVGAMSHWLWNSSRLARSPAK